MAPTDFARAMREQQSVPTLNVTDSGCDIDPPLGGD
jgi:hypothetical protein